jgi:hypothetical protein
MHKLSRVVTLVVGIMAAFAAMAGTASATTWHNTGGTAVTATGIGGTLTANGISLTCTSANATATAPASSAGPNYVVTGRATFNGCRLAGVSVTATCNFTATATSWTTPGTTSGQIAVSCTVTGGCTITGTVSNSSYVNGTPGVADVPASNTLRMGGAGCIHGSGAVSLTAQRFTTTSASPPLLEQP